MQLQPYQQRVVDEKTELDKKIHALVAFVKNDARFLQLAPEEQERLIEQNDVMQKYSEILGSRIAAF